MGKYVSLSAYARHRGVTVRAVQKARDDGRITVTANGRVDPDLADREWDENTRVSAMPPPKDGKPDGDAESFNDARARKETALADLAEMEAAELRGETVRVSELVPCWGEIATAVRARFLVLPSIAAPMIAPPGKTAEAQAVLRKLINEAFEELSHDGVPASAKERARRHAESSKAAA